MSSNTQGNELWFCHECHAEMRPLMVPTAHCASCNSDFVERIENAGNQDDPREFMEFPGGVPGDMDAFGGLLNLLMRGSPAPGQPAAARPLGGGGGGVRFEMRTGGAGDRGRTYVFGGHNTLGRDDHQPPLADFLDGAFGQGVEEHPNADRRRTPGGGAAPHGHLFGPALLALLGGHPAFAGFGGMPRGQMGDYAFDQEAFDAIITQLMEANNAGRPVAASEDLITNLPRRKVTVDDFLNAKDDESRGKECAVCKDTLLPSPETTELSEGPVTLVALPCAHEFHEDCIIPWLKNSGTCPVCRHQLVAQPDPHDHGQAPPNPWAPRPEQSQQQQQRSGIASRIPGVNTITNAASNIYHQLRHPGASSSSSPPGNHDSASPGPSSGSPPRHAQGTFGRSASPPQFANDDFYTSAFAEPPRPRHRRTASGGYVLGARTPSPENARRPYGFIPHEGPYNPWAASPSGQPRSSQRDSARSPRSERERERRAGGSRPQSPPGSSFPDAWHSQPDLD